MPRGIPPVTSIKLRLGGHNGRPLRSGGGFEDKPFEPKFFKKAAKKRVVRLHPPEDLFFRKEVRKSQLDLFEENNNQFKVIGEFPGLKTNDLIVQIEGNEVCAVSRPSEAERIYFGCCTLPEASTLSIKEKRTQNGFMILTLEKKVKKAKKDMKKRKTEKVNKIREAIHERNAG
jgi:HSP20 family molecular chaperone IbpA